MAQQRSDTMAQSRLIFSTIQLSCMCLKFLLPPNESLQTSVALQSTSKIESFMNKVTAV